MCVCSAQNIGCSGRVVPLSSIYITDNITLTDGILTVNKAGTYQLVWIVTTYNPGSGANHYLQKNGASIKQVYTLWNAIKTELELELELGDTIRVYTNDPSYNTWGQKADHFVTFYEIQE